MSRNPITLINNFFPNLTKTETKIANYILNNFNKITKINIKELANAIGVSESSIIRFTQNLGFSGYREFKISCALHENVNTEQSSRFDDLVAEENSLEFILKKYISGNITSLQNNMEEFDYKNIEDIAKLFLEHKKVFLVGDGYSGYIARGAYLKLKTIISDIHLSTNHFEAVQDSYVLDKNSLVFAISQSGESKTPLFLCEQGNNIGATTVCLTSSYNNQLYKATDFQIVPTTKFTNTGSNYFATEIIFKIILDSIIIYCGSHSKNSKSFATDFL